MNGRKRIAVLIDWYLPGTRAGGPVRSVFSLVNLLRGEYEFYIITTNKDLGSKTPYNDLTPDTLFTKDGINYYYFSEEKLNSERMLHVFSEIKPSLIYLNSFWSFNFSINIVKLYNAGRLDCPVLLAPRGMLGKGALGLKSFKKNLFISLTRLLGWYRKIVFHATQEQERKDIRAKFRPSKILVAPNVNALAPVENRSPKSAHELRLFFLSRISPVKNLHFALEVLKTVPAENKIQYDIFGNLEDHAYWKRCESIISELPVNITVSYKGELPFNKIRETISNYHCLLLPTLNENFGHAIVESLLCGCMVVISDQTPWNDVSHAGAGFTISLSEREKYKTAINTIAGLDQQGFETGSRAAIDYISKKINLTSAVQQYKSMFDECIKN